MKETVARICKGIYIGTAFNVVILIAAFFVPVVALILTVLVTGQEVSDVLYSYRSASDKTATRLLQLDALKKTLDYNRELLKYGYATYTDVLTSEQGYLTAQLNSVNDRLQQLTSVVSLYRSLGGGWK